MTKKRLAAATIVLALTQLTARANIILDVSGPSNTFTETSASGSTFIAAGTDQQPAGTGVMGSFLREDANGNNPTEQGYNTSATPPLDDLAGNFTHAIQLSAIPTITINNIVFREFLLDVNQSGGQTAPVSLNQVQLFQSTVDPGNTGFTTTAATASTPGSISFSSNPDMHQVFQMSNAATLYDVQVTSGSGSGVANMFLYVQDSLFTGGPNSYITLYSQFGNPSGAFGTTDGFEEWGVRTANGMVPIPEPSTLVSASIGGLAVLGFAWRRRKAKVAA